MGYETVSTEKYVGPNDVESTVTRRLMLSALGGSVLSTRSVGRVTAATESHYALVQGDRCAPIRPIRSDESVEQFYDYRLPEEYASDENGGSADDDQRYGSAGTEHLQRPRTSIAFLYRSPEALSLVFVHGSIDVEDAGSVTFRISGLPASGEWAVKDDLYRNGSDDEVAETNYDRWYAVGGDHRVDWTWGRNGTDGGVFRGLGDDFEIVVRPAFNEEATLYGEWFDGEITDWQFLSGPEGDPERISLALDEPIRITTGACDSEQ
jgi:hypothetical protein